VATDYEVFEQSDSHRRILRQEELILDVTEKLSRILQEDVVNKFDVAQGLMKTKAFMSQALAGDGDITLRTVADMATALGYKTQVFFFKDEQRE
jgi:hypothetical protein